MSFSRGLLNNSMYQFCCLLSNVFTAAYLSFWPFAVINQLTFERVDGMEHKEGCIRGGGVSETRVGEQGEVEIMGALGRTG